MTADLKLQYVNPRDLEANPWNPNVMDQEMYDKAVVSIRSFGFIDPITVRDHPRGTPRWQIIDGENRWNAAQDEHMQRVPIINLGIVEDVVAEQLTIVLNETRGQPDPTKLGQLLASLMKVESKETLLSRLPFSREAFDGLVGLPTIKWEEPQEPMRMKPGTMSGWVERTYRVPREVAEHLDQEIAKAKEARGLDTDWKALSYLVFEEG